MDADAFHKQIEDEMRKKKNVLDFEDFEDCINSCGIGRFLQQTTFSTIKVNSADVQVSERE